MVYLYKNSAYNFEIFEDSKQKKPTQIFNLPIKEARKKRQAKEKLLLLTKSFCSLIASGLTVGCFIFGQAKLTEYTHQISISSRELDDLKNRNDQLNIKLESEKISSNNILESVKEKNSVEMVIIDAGDKAEIKYE